MSVLRSVAGLKVEVLDIRLLHLEAYALQRGKLLVGEVEDETAIPSKSR